MQKEIRNFKLGCALRFSMFTDTSSSGVVKLCDAFGGRENLLRYCAENLYAVELRMVEPTADPTDVLNAVKELNSYGLTATIHGTICEANAFFAPYIPLFSSGLQSSYTITVHPTNDPLETESILKAVCALIEEKGYPAFIALENQRMKTADYYGACEDVTKIVEKIASPHLGTCFDFGHQLSSEKSYQVDALQPEFLDLVRHTHIHGLYEGRTHFPLDCGEAALERNIAELQKRGYNGVFSLEISSERYEDIFNVKDALVNSVNVLQTAIRQTALKHQMREFYKNGYTKALKELKTRFESAENGVALIGHSCYLIKFGKTRFAVDIAPSVLSVDRDAQTFILDWIKDFSGYILTHAHIDHYDPDFFARLPKDIIKYVPNFMELQAQNQRKTCDGAAFVVGDTRLEFFNSGHTRGNSVVPEYGFAIEYQGEKYLFPCDVRDYGFAYPKFENVRAVFVHLWLGKGQALQSGFTEYAQQFCEYVNGFGAKETYIAHLYDVHRPIEEMWSELHFALVKDRLVHNAKPIGVGELLTF